MIEIRRLKNVIIFPKQRYFLFLKQPTFDLTLYFQVSLVIYDSQYKVNSNTIKI